MMITLTRDDFIDIMLSRRPNNFNYEGLLALFEYFELSEEVMREDIVFDPVAICGEFIQYKTPEDALNDYPHIRTLKDLFEHTTVIGCDDGSVIVQSGEF